MANRGTGFRHSLRLRLLIIILLVWLIPTLTLSRFIGTLLPSLRQASENSLLSGAEYAWSRTVRDLDALIELSRGATYDQELSSAWDQLSQGLLSETEFVRLSRNYLERKYGRESLILCAVYVPDSPEGLFLSPRSQADRALEYQQSAHPALLRTREALDTRCVFLREGERIYLVRNLFSTAMQRYGLLALEVDSRALFDSLDEVAARWEASQALRLDDIGAGLPDWDAYPDGLSDSGGDEMHYLRRSASRDWSLAWHLAIPRDKITGQARQFRRIFQLLNLLLLPVMGLIAFYTYRRFSRPVSLLVNAAHQVESGAFGTVVPMQGKDELGTLGRAFSAMSTRIKELVDRTYKEEIALRDAQIQALQSRINPHFINNALEDINWQARMDGSRSVSRMVEALSVLLNATMAHRDQRTVSLREELSVVDAYLYFIQERYGDKLTWSRQVDEALLDCTLPLLTLQPVLENAVEHGIAPAGGGEIAISIHREQGAMRIEIMNTGRPLSPEDEGRMRSALAGTLEGRHVGLSNIASRLRLIYHGEASLQAVPDGPRTLVQMTIPIAKEDRP